MKAYLEGKTQFSVLNWEVLQKGIQRISYIFSYLSTKDLSCGNNKVDFDCLVISLRYQVLWVWEFVLWSSTSQAKFFLFPNFLFWKIQTRGEETFFFFLSRQHVFPHHKTSGFMKIPTQLVAPFLMDFLFSIKLEFRRNWRFFFLFFRFLQSS